MEVTRLYLALNAISAALLDTADDEPDLAEVEALAGIRHLLEAVGATPQQFADMCETAEEKLNREQSDLAELPEELEAEAAPAASGA